MVHKCLSNRKMISGIIAGLILLISILCFLIRQTYIKEEQANR